MTAPWVQTCSGRPFDLLSPRAEDVVIADIAHALSRINRFSGHTIGEPYSVAHHSMLVADLLASWGAPVAVVREGLLHDAPEAYYGDTVSPVQRAARELLAVGIAKALHRGLIVWGPGAMGDDEIARIDALARELDPLRALRERIDPVVRAALSLPEHETAIVKRADLVALAIERRDLMVPCERDWELPEYAPTSAPCGRLYVLDGAPDGRPHITRDRLCSWSIARDRFAAYLAELDARIGGAS